LDGLLADPAAFNLLPAETQNALYAQVATLEAAFRAKILTRGCDGSPPATTEPDRAVRIEEAMGLLGMTKDDSFHAPMRPYLSGGGTTAWKRQRARTRRHGAKPAL